MEYIGYHYNHFSKHIWTIKFKYDNPIVNQNVILQINKFRIISIEDIDNNFYKSDKIENKIYGINSNHNFHKYPINCYLNKNNIISHIIVSDTELYQKYTGEIKLYYPSGNKEMEFYLLNGKIQGNFKSYMNNGEITEDSNFVNGKRHGDNKFIRYEYEYNYPDRTENMFEIKCIFNYGDLLEKKCTFDKKYVYKRVCFTKKDEYKYDEKTNIYTSYYGRFLIQWTYKNILEYEMKFINEDYFDNYLYYITKDMPHSLIERNHYFYL
jgi:antitoxin component YwqK of YwqJK toxin-antitoxin module